MKGIILALFIWSSGFLTWTGEAEENLTKTKLIQEAPGSMACRMSEEYTAPACLLSSDIHYEPTVEMSILLHESQHDLATRYGMDDSDWNKFARIAMKALRQGYYSREEILEFKYYCSYGAHEGHAELPWIVKGRIPSVLQPWYPWFDLDMMVALEAELKGLW